MLKKIGYAALAVGIMLLLLVGYVMINFNALPFDEQVIEQLQIGMSMEEVRALTSAPKAVEDDGKTWVFYRELSWPSIFLKFSDEGKLEEVVIDY